MSVDYRIPSGPCVQDLTGRIFGNLTVVSFSHRYETPGGSKRYRWWCQCECGEATVVDRGNLFNGSVISCGCKWQEWLHSTRRRTHNKQPRQVYRAWARIIQRCENNRLADWANYGGRGVIVCPEWKRSYEIFRDWALVNGWRKGLQIDRIDVNGNYEPSNCRWTDAKQQARNRRNNRLLTVHGETHCVARWAELQGMSAGVLENRLLRGWTDEQAVLTPLKTQREHPKCIQITWNGKTHCAAEWDRIQGFPKITIARRLGKGWSIERALTEPVHTEKRNKRYKAKA